MRIPLSLQRAKSYRKLTTKKGRRESGLILVEGERLVREAIDSGWTMQALIHDPATFAERRFRPFSRAAVDRNVPVFTTTSKLMSSLATTDTAPGILAIVENRKSDLALIAEADSIVICDSIKEPGNLGAILRTACGLGVRAAILLEGTVELTNPKTVRGTMGAIFRFPIVDHVAPEAFADILRTESQSRTLYIADSHGSDEQPLPRKADRWALVIGGEADGPKADWRSLGLLPISLHIPLAAGVDSLNSSVAAGILVDRLMNRSN